MKTFLFTNPNDGLLIMIVSNVKEEAFIILGKALGDTDNYILLTEIEHRFGSIKINNLIP